MLGRRLYGTQYYRLSTSPGRIHADQVPLTTANNTFRTANRVHRPEFVSLATQRYDLDAL
jgi:hypothetical protein